MQNKIIKKSPGRIALKTLVIALLIGLTFIMIIPFLWMLSSSFKLQKDVMAVPMDWIPDYFYPDNYLKVLHINTTGKDYHFFLAYWNSIKIAVTCTFTSMLTASMAGYAFAKIRFRGSNVLFLLYLAQMMIPTQVTLIPRFIFFSQLDLVNTHLPLLLPSLVSITATFLMRQSFISVPNELRESAKLDGAGEFRIYAQIMLPIIKPTIGALATIQFMNTWNDYLDPLVFISNWRLNTLPLALNQFVGEEVTQYNLITAACCLTVIPVMLVFLLGQKFFVKGLMTGAVKG